MSLNISLAPNAMPCHTNFLAMLFLLISPKAPRLPRPVRIFQRPKDRQTEGVLHIL
jgi:hypothetical protein